MIRMKTNKYTNMKKYIIIYALAITVSFTAFAQEASSKQDRFMKINEPYVFMSFLGNNDRIAGMQLPDWSVGLGDRYTCLHKPTGLSFDLDAGVEYGFLKKTDKNDCFSASARIALSNILVFVGRHRHGLFHACVFTRILSRIGKPA